MHPHSRARLQLDAEREALVGHAPSCDLGGCHQAGYDRTISSFTSMSVRVTKAIETSDGSWWRRIWRGRALSPIGYGTGGWTKAQLETSPTPRSLR